MKRILATTLAILSYAFLAFALPGDLDLTFNGTGKSVVKFSNVIDSGRGTAIQTDGKIVAAGFCSAPAPCAGEAERPSLLPSTRDLKG